MVKVPHAGRIKTRLARQIGTVSATAFYRHAAAAVIRRLSAGKAWSTWLAVAPDTAHAGRRWSAHRPIHWPRGIPRRPQGDGDLGRRMQRIMEWPGTGPTIIVGTDIPSIRPSHIATAFRLLGSGDAVLGPTPDGGYWLVGLKRTPRILRPFGGVRWSTEHALTDTVARLAGHSLALADKLSDVDDAATWAEVRHWSGRTVLPASARPAQPTDRSVAPACDATGRVAPAASPA